jgi:hypothetical protein
VAHTTTLNVGAGGDSLATYDLAAGGAAPTAAGKLSLGSLYFGATSSTTPTIATTANPYPVNPTQLPAAAAQADGAANPTTTYVGAMASGWNGATWDRVKTASAANVAGASGVGVALATGPGNWTTNHVPSTATLATITKSAGGSGVRHVCNSITATVATGATAQTPILVYLRDGATTAGTILWAGTLSAPANSAGVLAVTGLSIVGTANTAMCLEFSAAGVTASQCVVTLGGYSTS